MNSNLPRTTNPDSADKVKSFFDSYFVQQISFPAQLIDATVGFFTKRGFDNLAASSTAIVLLQQAKLDGVNVFDLLDTLNGLEDIQLSAIVTEVLNYNRESVSTLGYRQATTGEQLEARNIVT
jgi:hypothetical protein